MHGKFSEPVAARKGENGRAAERETAIASATVRNSALTVGTTRAIITTGRDDAFGWALSLCCGEAAYQLALDGGLFLFLIFAVASDLDRGEHKRDNHDD